MSSTDTAAKPGLIAGIRGSGAWHKLLAFSGLLALLVVFSLASPNFLQTQNILAILQATSVNGVLAVAATLVIITGGIDLSVGTLMTFCAVLTGVVLTYLGLPLPLGIAGAILTGTASGLVSGFIIAKLKVPPFIATLGMLYVARGAAMLLSDGATFPNLVGRPDLGNEGFPLLGSATVLGLPVTVLLLAVLALAAAFVARDTPFGRRVYAVGGNERAALLSGVRVDRVKIAVYVISGICAALVGMIVSSELVAAHPASGETFELSAIAAVVLGGASLSGGRGTVGGALIGACVIGVLGDGLVMMGVSEFWQMVIKGLVIIAAVVLDQLQGRLTAAGKA